MNIPGFQKPGPLWCHLDSFQPFVFTNSASTTASVHSSACACMSTYIPRCEIGASKAMCTCGFDYFGIIPLQIKSFSGGSCGIKNQGHILGRSVFLTTEIFFSIW